MGRSRQPMVYQLKVTLKGTKPPLWRRLAVLGDTRLGEFHAVLQIAMGWSNCHLHEFALKVAKQEPRIEDLDALVHGGRWNLNFSGMRGERRLSDPDFELEETEDEAAFRLDQIAPAEKYKFRYEYDFGDSWSHEILVEKIVPPDPAARYPRCLGGKRACPPEDCGGVWGYADLLVAVADPGHDRHDELIEWLGGEFDPEHFDADAVNAALAGLARSGGPPSAV